MLEAVYLNSSPVQQTARTSSADFWAQFWEKVFSKNPQIMKRFNRMKMQDFIKIIYDKNLSEVQKFEKIFGVKVSDLKQYGLAGQLGDIFEDISNFFSNENLRKIENGIRQGQSISNSIANGINALRNQGSQQNANELTTIRDQQSNLYFGAQSIYEKYGPQLMLAGGALLLILLFKK